MNIWRTRRIYSAMNFVRRYTFVNKFARVIIQQIGVSIRLIFAPVTKVMQKILVEHEVEYISSSHVQNRKV